MTATDVTGFDAIFSTGFFATFSRFSGALLAKLPINTGEKAKNPVESLQWMTAPRNCRFLSLVVVELVLMYKILSPNIEDVVEGSSAAELLISNQCLESCYGIGWGSWSASDCSNV